MGTFSPTAPQDEIDGMKFAEIYFNDRQTLCAASCRAIGAIVEAKIIKAGKKSPAFANGFRRMAYIVSQER